MLFRIVIIYLFYVGSAITILIDIEQLQDAASVISSLRTLDDLTANLLEADFFSVVYGRYYIITNLIAISMNHLNE